MLLILAVVSISVLASFLCSLCEASLFAVTPARVEVLRRHGTSSGRRLALLRGDIEDAIAGILAMNTIAVTIGGVWVGALVGERYGPAWLGVFSVAFSLAILFIAEMAPKAIGVPWAGVLAVRLAWTIQVMVWAVWPLAKLCTFLMRFMTRRAPSSEPTEEELLVMAEMAALGGEILAQESRWVKNVLRLDDVTVRQLMTPRAAIQSLPADLPLAEVEIRARQWVHSRVPLTEDNDLDRVVGVVQRRAVLDRIVHENSVGMLRDLMRPALFVSEETRGHQLLEMLVNQRQHLALVTDAQNRVTGIISLEDVMEYLLGRQIVGEHDAHPEMVRMAQERSRFHGDAKSHARPDADPPQGEPMP